jgi:16S rRNA (cytosine967-C5)-methyltransferase
VLRSYLRSRSSLIESIDMEYEKLSFPKHLYDSIKADWPENYLEILTVSNQKPPLTLRVNQQSSSREEYLETLLSEEIGFEITNDSVIGFTLNKPVDVGSIPGFSQGAVSVQDESAQLTAFALDLEKGFRVLDGCAAPGGKTCLLLETQPDITELVAIDFPHRIQGIHENLERMGLSAKVVESDMSKLDYWWDQVSFDRILLDVPCSGTGVIRRHPDIRHRRRQEDIKKFHDQQIKLLNTAWQLLKPGGVMLYVTCSVLKYENDGVIGEFLENLDNYQLQSLQPVFGLETEFGRQRLPGVHSGDGFYYCKLQKQS